MTVCAGGRPNDQKLDVGYLSSFNGLAVLNSPNDDALIHVIAVHGIYGIRQKPWARSDSPESTWLEPAFTRALPGPVRVISYTYESPPALLTRYGIQQEAARLLDAILSHLESHAEKYESAEKSSSVVFVSHDIGGLLVKAALIKARLMPEKYSRLTSIVRGLMFFACPHRCSSLQSLQDQFVTLLTRDESPQQDNTATLARSLAETAIEINGDFIHMGMLLQAGVANIFSTDEDVRLRVFDKYTVTLDIPSERRVASPKPHVNLTKAFLHLRDIDKPDFKGAVDKSWAFSDLEPETVNRLHMFISQVAPIYPPRRAADPSDMSALSGQQAVLKDFVGRRSSCVLHVGCASGTAATSMASESILSYMSQYAPRPKTFHFEFDARDVRLNNVDAMMRSLWAQLVCDSAWPLAFRIKWALIRQSVTNPRLAADSLYHSWRYFHFTNDCDKAIYVVNGLDKCDESWRCFVSEIRDIISTTDSLLKIIILTADGSEKSAEIRDMLATLPAQNHADLDASSVLTAGSGSSPTTQERFQLALLLDKMPRFKPLASSLEACFLKPGWDSDLVHVVLKWLRHTKLATSVVETQIRAMDPSSPASVFAAIVGTVPKERQLWLRRFLFWTQVAKRRLRVREFCAVSTLAVELSREPDISKLQPSHSFYWRCALDDVREWLGGIFVVRDGEVCLGHDAFDEVLRPETSDGELYRGHFVVLETCTAYLSLAGRGRHSPVVSVLDSEPRQSDEGDSDLVSLVGSLPYAIEHWASHYKHLRTSSDEFMHSQDQFVAALLGDANFLQYWEPAYRNTLSPFMRRPVSEERLSPLVAAAELGLDDLVREFLPASSDERRVALEEAARNGRLRTVMILLEPDAEDDGAKAESHIPFTEEAVLAASVCGNDQIFRELVKRMVLCRNQHQKKKYSSLPILLLQASWLGLDDVVKQLLDLGADPNLQDMTETSARLPLHFAARRNKVHVLRVLLDAGASLTAKEQDGAGANALHAACNYGAKECVEELVKRGAPLESREGAGNLTPLHLASQQGYYEIVQFLLEQRDDPQDYTEADVSPLSLAAMYGMPRCAEMLLRHKADPNVPKSKPPLRGAVMNEDIAMCRMLLDYGAHVDHVLEGQSPYLVQAVEFKNMELVNLLLEYGPNVDLSQINTGSTPLSMAAALGFGEAIRRLLTAGASIELQNSTAQTPLWSAAREGHEEATRILAEAGADVNAPAASDWAPLQLAYNSPGVTRILLDHGADVNHESAGGTALRLAAYWNEPEVVKLLLEKNPNLTTAFVTALDKGHHEIVGLLLEAGADVNHVYPLGTGFNALRRAIKADSDESVRVLLEFNPDVKTRDYEERTVLHAIHHSTPVSLVRRLVNAGSDLDEEDNVGRTPLWSAVIGSNVEVARYLVSKKVRLQGFGVPGEDGLMHAACRFGSLAMVEFMMQQGLDVNADGGWLGTPLQAACLRSPFDSFPEENQVSIVRYLIGEGKADVNAATGLHGSPLNTAAGVCCSEIVGLLVDAGARVDAADPVVGMTATHLASSNSLAALHALKLDEHDDDANFKRRDLTGRLPLHYAASSGDVEVLKEVLARSRRVGLQIDERDHDGWTPLMWAARTTGLWWTTRTYDHVGVINLLLDENADTSVTARGIRREWTPWKVARYHGADPEIVRRLAPKGSAKSSNDATTPKSSPGSACNCCFLGIWGIFYKCFSCKVSFDLCFKCYRLKDVLHPQHEFAEYGQDWDEQMEEPVARGIVRSDTMASEHAIDGAAGEEDDDEEVPYDSGSE